MKLSLLATLLLTCALATPALALATDELIQPGDYRPSIDGICGRHIEVVIPGKKYLVEFTTRNSNPPSGSCRDEGATKFVECSTANGETKCTRDKETWYPLPDGNIAVEYASSEGTSFKMYQVRSNLPPECSQR